MASHYLFEAEFCNPASGWEKGQIEKNVQDAQESLSLGVASKTNIVNIIRRRMAPTPPPLADTPQSMMLSEEPEANIARYDHLRSLHHAA